MHHGTQESSTGTCDRRAAALAAALGALLLAPPPVAAGVHSARAGPTPDAQRLGPSDCPTLFGTEADRQHNRERRRKLLRGVDAAPDDVVVVHSGPWHDPDPLELFGVELMDAPAGRKGRVALLRISDRTAPSGCPAGLYRVPVDASLGARARILAVLPHRVLVEHDKALRVLLTDDADPIQWRTVWASSWTAPKPDVWATGKQSKRKQSRRRRGKRGR